MYRIDEFTWQAQLYLVAVSLRIASKAAELYGPSSRAARVTETNLRGRERADRMEEAKVASERKMGNDSKGLRCLACLTRPCVDQRMQEWSGSPCSRVPAGIHPIASVGLL